MEFVIRPILHQMDELYNLPRGRERFDRYLYMLQGETKGEMILPIAGYNPMGNESVQQRIQELIRLGAEQLIDQNLRVINTKYSSLLPTQTYEVVINLSDDLGGAWTDRFASHYTNTFNFGPIAKRNFCTPYLWTSDEAFTEKLVMDRAYEAIFRTIHFAQYGKPKTLEEHLRQEAFVSQQGAQITQEDVENFETIRKFYEAHRDSEDYNLIFNFFYGDAASAQLGYKLFGNVEFAGFKLASVMTI